MKHAGLALVLFSTIILTVTILFAIGHKTNRENEAGNALDVAIENTLDNLMYDKTYTINNTDEFVADFLEDLLLQIDSDSEVNVVCKAVDIEKGLFSVEVTLSFLYNNGNKGYVSSERTVIFEQGNVTHATTAGDSEVFTVEYYAFNGADYALYKTITVMKNDPIINLTPPEIDGKSFYKWATENGVLLNAATYKVKSNLKIYAIYQ